VRSEAPSGACSSGCCSSCRGWGAAVGAADGALAGKFSDCGIDDDFIKEVGENIKPGDSALFLYTADAVKEKVAAAVEGEPFEILQTNLSLEDEEALREAFGAGA
jgi:uncharacterized membrane protein